MLEELLQGDPDYEERLAEQVLAEYLRIHQSRIDGLIRCGIDYDDVVQELRIALWRAWVRFDQKKGFELRRWLSYKMDYALRGMHRKAVPFYTVSLEVLGDYEDSDLDT